MKKIALSVLLLAGLKAFPQTLSRQDYRDDFEYFCKSIQENYCYFEKKQVNWKLVKQLYDPQIDTVSSRRSFTLVMEKVLNELYDHHCSLGTNTKISRRLVPTAADCWAAYVHGKPRIVELRKGFGAERAGIRAGMEVIAVNDVPVEKAILPFLSHTVNQESKSFALRLLLAGDHVTPRKLTLNTRSGMVDFFPDEAKMRLENIHYDQMVTGRSYGSTGYIAINNFLFDNAVIPEFDSVLNTLLHKKALIIDLRETPSGGNSTVARAILGRFIANEHFYQKHELYAEEKETGIKRSWAEIVSPRGRRYTGKVAILGDHWTGSVAEAITIGFDGIKRATVIGTQLARLNGAIQSLQMPHSGIGFSFPTERLSQINGQPRELFLPAIFVNVTEDEVGKDVILQTALQYFQSKTISK
jgi:C-terminal processing protease CtpA/Prc